MKTLSKEASRVMDILTYGLEQGEAATFDNSNGTYMPAHIDYLYDLQVKGLSGAVYAVAHYFKQNGDMCCDPDMTFLKTKTGYWLPLTFQQAIPPIYHIGIKFEDGNALIARKQQASITSFANMWMKNIKEQQSLQASKARVYHHTGDDTIVYMAERK